MEKSDRDHAVRLLHMAQLDLKALGNMLEPEDFSESIFGFHAQQATEKALKAWIAFIGLSYPKSHDLSDLLRILTEAGKNMGPYPDIADFSVFAVQYRYEAYDSDEGLDRNAVVAKVTALVGDVAAAIGA